MVPVALPEAPTVEVSSEQRGAFLPASARQLLARESCSLAEAARFLGLSVKPDGTAGSTAHAQAQRYRERVHALMFEEKTERGRVVVRPRPFHPAGLIPRMVHGRWMEIPNTKAGVIRVRTDLLVPMVYAELGWPS